VPERSARPRAGGERESRGRPCSADEVFTHGFGRR
jgi:hypothetical protein